MTDKTDTIRQINTTRAIVLAAARKKRHQVETPKKGKGSYNRSKLEKPE